MKISYSKWDYEKREAGERIEEDLDTVLVTNGIAFASDENKGLVLLSRLIEMLHSKGILSDHNISSFLGNEFSSISNRHDIIITEE